MPPPKNHGPRMSSTIPTPNGFRPRPLTRWNRYYVPQADLAEYRVGNVVRTATGTDAYGTRAVTLQQGSGPMVGVIVSVDPGLPATGGLQSNGQLLSVPASKLHDYYLWVDDDPEAVYVAIDDGAVPANLTPANVGSFVNGTSGSGVTASGAAAAGLSSTTFGGAAGSGCWKVLGLVPGSAYGPGASWLVQSANHELQTAQGGAGGNGGSTTLAGLTDVGTFDLASRNPSVAAVKAMAMANAVPVVDNLQTPLVSSALSANMGVNLSQQVSALVTQFQQLTAGGTITIVNDTPIGTEDNPVTGNVLANDTSTAGALSVVQFVVAGLSGINAAGATVVIPSVGSITLAANGAYTFTPVANWNGAVPVVTYQCTNGTDIKNGNLSITLSPVNDAPVAQADSTGTLQGQAVTINVLANDSDIDGDTLTITQINGSAIASGGTATITNGTVTLNADKTLTYTPGASVTGAQTFSYTINDGKGGTAVANVTVNVVATGGSVATPVILYTDAPSGPTGFPTATGEGGLGGYLSIFGRNLFNQASDLGSLTRVYIGGVEVASYRYAGQAVTYSRTGVQRITVQVGTLASAAVGTALAITVVRNGTATSNNDKTFTPSGGRVLFVAQNGSDSSAAAGDITKPWRHLQVVDNNNTAATMTGVASALVAGDQVVIRGGNWTDSMGFDNAWFRFRNFANQGQAKKFVHFTAYPGPAGANTPEVVSYVTPTGTPPNTVGSSRYRGGFHGANSAYAGQVGDYVAISNLHLASSADTSSDGCGINMQYSSTAWWEVNNEIGPWPSAINSKAAGFSGHALGSRCWGNYIHDLQCTGAQETHGMYIDSPDTSTPDASMDIDIGWNWVGSAPGGNGCQLNDNLGNAGSGTWKGFKGITIHHNFFESYAKYGLNFGPSTVQAKAWNNVFNGGAFGWCRLDSSATGIDLQVDFNTAYNVDQTVSGPGNGQMISTASTGGSGTVKLRGNIMVAGPQTIAGSQLFAVTGGTPATWQPDGNLYFGPNQSTPWTAPNFSTDAHGVFSNPLFTATAAADFSLQAGSPAIDAAYTTAPTYVVDDFIGTGRPQGGAADLGAFERLSTFPYVTAAPTFGGSARVGSASTVSTGTWGNGPISAYAYQWFTASTLNGTPTPIPGATSSSYTWQGSDYGKFGGCQVTATNAAGSTTKAVFTGAAVLANLNAPANTTPASITGTAGVGNVLTRVAGVWTPSSGADAASIAWIWTRGGVAITGTANAATYTQLSSDDSLVITLVETATNQWGSVTQAASNSITVPHSAAAPQIIGTGTSFNSASPPATITKTVQAGDVIALFIAAGNNAVYNLAITDNSSGNTYAGWAVAGGTNVDPTKGGWVWRMFSGAGSVTVSVPNTGAAFFAGEAFLVRGVDPATPLETGDVGVTVTSSPLSMSPGTTAFAKDLILAGWAGTDSLYATGFTRSDTFVASYDDTASSTKQVQITSRTTSAAGAQSAMTFSWTGGTSGSDTTAAGALLKLRGH